MPVRNIPKNYRNVTGLAASAKKSVDDAQFESTLEHDFITLLDESPTVRIYEVQPAIIPYVDPDGVSRTYTPDALVRFMDNTLCLYEVKYRKDLKKDWKILKPKFKAAIRYGKPLHWRFRIITEKEIRTPYLENMKFLKAYKRYDGEDARMRMIDHYVYELRETTPKEIIAIMAKTKVNKAQVLYLLWCMVAHGLIKTDLNHPLTMESPLWHPKTLLNH